MRLYDIRKEMMIAQYQWGFFRTELKQKKAHYEHWKSNQKSRAEKDGLNYMTYEDLYNDYLLGNITQSQFRWQKKLYNKIIADNWHRAEKIAWLEENCELYRKKYEALAEYYQGLLRKKQNLKMRKYYKKKNGIKRRTYDFTKNRSKYNMPKKEKDALKAKEQAEKEAIRKERLAKGDGRLKEIKEIKEAKKKELEAKGDQRGEGTP